MELTSENVDRVTADCLFPDGTTDEDALAKGVLVDGILNKWAFRPDKIKEHEEDINSMVRQLPEPFFKSKGGGWTFLNACNRQDGVQWTGLHKMMDQLFVLGMATGKVKLCLPRKMWNILPGGMPYYQIDE